MLILMFSRPLPSVDLAYHYKLPNCPGKSSIGVIANFPPNSSTPPHRHAGASVSVLVLEGQVINKMNDGPTQVLAKGESFFEAPGCHHRVSDNYSATEPAKILATFVIDDSVVENGGYGALTVIDEEFADVKL